MWLALWFCRSKFVGPCVLRVALPPPTVRRKDGYDLAFLGNFVRRDCGFRWRESRVLTAASHAWVDVYQVGRLLICGFGKTVCEAFRLRLNLSSDA